jgi:hypothetical protein
MGGGIAAAVIGVGLVGVGAWQLSKAAKMKKQRNVALAPVFTRDFAGLSVTGRF